ncbi:Syd protein [Streptomyces sp. NBRC 110611]|uniref:C40 family peptidase n=1 Tax=Streptomyces sp. NBRC 110611 TaxID=1621259 RepID=UPI00082B69F2|nr:NlpC/P60 family protein [Streptomyces sp. NBRC 110611]GAU71429.1 Syd protein [Streptomyces sp. NBRC 110611]
MLPKKRPLLHVLIVLSLLTGSAYLTIELRKEEHGARQSWERLKSPDRTVLRGDSGQILAIFTDNSRTATLKGPSRAFSESAAISPRVITDDWVRLMPQAWHVGSEKERWFKEWFRSYRDSRQEDLFAIAFQYVRGAPVKKDDKGIAYAGDAKFGPINHDLDKHHGTPRLEQSDFFHYLGIPYTFYNGTLKQPKASRYRAIDCSGFIRMVFGYRSHYPLAPSDYTGNGLLPRTADGIGRSHLGAEIIPLSGPTPWYERPHNIDALQPGDLIFFKIDGHTGNRLDHVGLYLGPDTEGHKIFISSRKKANGPTIGNKGGVSRLDGSGFYAQRLRKAIRL